jgi:hypothetical protein
MVTLAGDALVVINRLVTHSIYISYGLCVDVIGYDVALAELILIPMSALEVILIYLALVTVFHNAA